jgi:allantoinase
MTIKMPTFDLIIRNGQIVAEDTVVQADIAIADEKFVEIGPNIAGDATEKIDATGLHLFPGLIDAHVHFNEPGRADWEGWTTGSNALAAGGGTTCFEMPLNAHPPTIDAAAFDAKLAATNRQSRVDFALWGGLVPGNVDKLEELANRGVIGFKAFMSNSGIDDFEAADDLTLYEGMNEAARLGLTVAVHAESNAITANLAIRAVSEGRTTARDYLASRPAIAEWEAINRALFFAGETGCKLHIVHVSTARGVVQVFEARSRGINVSCETCAHYLVLTEDDVEWIGAAAKCAPPLRPQAEVDSLWNLLAEGAVQFVTSDHSPAPASMKTGADFFKIWGGISGIQSTLAVLLTEGVHRRNLPLPLIAAVSARNTACWFELPSKGRLAVGFDADLALVALNDDYMLTEHDLLDRHRLSPYRGRSFRGRVVRTILRGQTIFHVGQVVGPPSGRLLRPERL